MTSIMLVTLVSVCIYAACVVFLWSLYIRRWHDLGKSGWYSLLALIPFVNLVVLIYLFVAKGDEGPNTYGNVNIEEPFLASMFGTGPQNSVPSSSPVVPNSVQ